MNMRDFRAWYGLGQAYEILKMPLYCLYYFRMAQSLKPDDSRMLLALGDVYDKLDRLHDAKKCYWKAHCVGDLECIALLRLAKCVDYFVFSLLIFHGNVVISRYTHGHFPGYTIG
jgi:anaphase-promoting complex subunit 8